MKLDDFAAENSLREEEELDDYEDSTEADLSNAISILEDCYQLFDDILNKKGDRSKLTANAYSRMRDLSIEVFGFTSQFEDDVKPEVVITDRDSWKTDI